MRERARARRRGRGRHEDEEDEDEGEGEDEYEDERGRREERGYGLLVVRQRCQRQPEDGLDPVAEDDVPHPPERLALKQVGV